MKTDIALLHQKMRESGLTSRDIGALLGVNDRTVRSWFRSESHLRPSEQQIRAIGLFCDMMYGRRTPIREQPGPRRPKARGCS